MTTQPSAEATSATANEDPPPEQKKVTISMPGWMLDDLRRRARQRGITVTELMRRAVSLERMLFEDPDNEIVLRNIQSGREAVVKLV